MKNVIYHQLDTFQNDFSKKIKARKYSEFSAVYWTVLWTENFLYEKAIHRELQTMDNQLWKKQLLNFWLIWN